MVLSIHAREIGRYLKTMNLQPIDFKAVAAKGCFVYCYLREHDLTPYYVGLASYAERPFDRHSVAIPKDKARVRILKSGLTHFDVCKWEMFYINHYGRKDNGTGILRNRTDGGEGTVGRVWTDEQKAQISAALKGHSNRSGADAMLVQTAERYGMDLDDYKALSAPMRSLMRQRWAMGICNLDELLKPSDKGSAARERNVSQKFDAAERYGISVEFWDSLNERQKATLLHRYTVYGFRGQKLIANITDKSASAKARGKLQMIKGAKKYGVDIDWYLKLSKNQRNALTQRFSKGKRGADLTAGLVAA